MAPVFLSAGKEAASKRPGLPLAFLVMWAKPSFSGFGPFGPGFLLLATRGFWLWAVNSMGLVWPQGWAWSWISSTSLGILWLGQWGTPSIPFSSSQPRGCYHTSHRETGVSLLGSDPSSPVSCPTASLWSTFISLFPGGYTCGLGISLPISAFLWGLKCFNVQNTPTWYMVSTQDDPIHYRNHLTQCMRVLWLL